MENMLVELQTAIPAECDETFQLIMEIIDSSLRYSDTKGFYLVNRTDIPFSIRKELKPYLVTAKKICNAGLKNDMATFNSMKEQFKDLLRVDTWKLGQVLNQYFASRSKSSTDNMTLLPEDTSI